jgi:hypothetical protein
MGIRIKRLACLFQLRSTHAIQRNDGSIIIQCALNLAWSTSNMFFNVFFAFFMSQIGFRSGTTSHSATAALPVKISCNVFMIRMFKG